MFLSRLFVVLSLIVSVAQAGLFSARKLSASELTLSSSLQKASEDSNVDLETTLSDELENESDNEWTVPDWLDGGNRHLLQSCEELSDTNAFACLAAVLDGNSDTGVYGSCGGLSDRKDENWCEDSDGTDICCGSSDDCCEPNIGAIVGISVAIFVVIVASIVACCFCCPCCCIAKRRKARQEGSAPATAVAVEEK